MPEFQDKKTASAAGMKAQQATAHWTENIGGPTSVLSTKEPVPHIYEPGDPRGHRAEIITRGSHGGLVGFGDAEASQRQSGFAARPVVAADYNAVPVFKKQPKFTP